MWIQVSAGAAPIESCRFVYLFLNHMKRECLERNIKVETVDFVEGEKRNTLKSVFLKLEGENAKTYGKSIEGSMLWVCKSEYRPNHKRKNWFIEIEVFEDEASIELDPKQVKIETMRCGGNGGQNVNKLETGVRITHLSTGIVVKAQEERSQYRNKKLAMSRLIKKLDELANQGLQKQDQDRWEKHQSIKRGEPLRTFEGSNFREVIK